MKQGWMFSTTAFAIVAACSGDLVIDNGKGPGSGSDASPEADAGGASARKDGGGGLAPALDAPSASGGAAGSSNEAGVTAGAGATEGGAPREGGAPPIDDTCGVSVKLDTGPPSEPSAIAIDESSVYWVTTQELRRVSKSGKDAVAITADSVAGVAVDDTYVYWTSYSDTLSRSPKTGVPAPLVLQHGFGSPSGLVADGGTLYVVTNQGLARVSGDVGATPKILTTDISSSAIAMDRANLYFGTNQGKLVKFEKSTGATVALVSANPHDIAVDETGVYFTSGTLGSSTVQRVNAIDGRIATIGGPVDNSFGLDSEAVYFLTRTPGGQGALVQVPKSSGGAITLTTPVQLGASLSGHSIAADDTYVFYVSGENLMRYKKCSHGPEDAGTDPAHHLDGGCPSRSFDGGTVDAPSCVGLAANCGPCGGENCCDSPRVQGGTFYRTYTGPNLSDRGAPATISNFRLDRFEITVGRFRRFISDWDAGYRPAAGAGKHAHLDGGQGLSQAGGHERGWNEAWASDLPVTTTGTGGWDGRLSCDPAVATWTSTPGAKETEPVRCLDWYAAYAFCIWDGGFLPSEAEWAYAATGGAEQRAFPWSSPPESTEIDCAHANYLGRAGGTDYCVQPGVGSTYPVGRSSLLGDGKYGQTDLAGNVAEWALDTYSDNYVPGSCVDCEASDPPMLGQVLRGGGYDYVEADLHATARNFANPGTEARGIGARCARSP